MNCVETNKSRTFSGQHARLGSCLFVFHDEHLSYKDDGFSQNEYKGRSCGRAALGRFSLGRLVRQDCMNSLSYGRTPPKEGSKTPSIL